MLSVAEGARQEPQLTRVEEKAPAAEDKTTEPAVALPAVLASTGVQRTLPLKHRDIGRARKNELPILAVKIAKKTQSQPAAPQPRHLKELLRGGVNRPSAAQQKAVEDSAQEVVRAHRGKRGGQAA